MKHETFENGLLISSIEYFKFENLEDYKKHLVRKVDEVTTDTIIKTGFVFEDGKSFSMSTNAQINWSNLMQMDNEDFPLPVTTLDDEIYMLSLANRKAFYRAALNAKKQPLINAQTKKVQIKNLTTLQECEDFEQTL